MVRVTVATLVLLALGGATAVSQESHPASAAKPGAYAMLMPGLGHHHHPITTSSAEAQRFFDQGLTLVYAFNHEEAVRSFRRSAELDPEAPMPYWGIALAVGPNYNMDVDPEHEKAAYEAIQKARSLATARVSESERAYVEALAKRYSNDPKADFKALAAAYKDAMGKLMRQFPDDLDAATLYAESMMDLNPWKLWTPDGRPAEGTTEIVSVLASVLRRDPEHIGANHFFIHATEASPNPEQALPSAKRLETLAPGAGHLVHMPAHIYQRTGDFEAAARANQAAAAADRAYFKASGTEQSMYGLMYYSHNLQFLAAAYCSAGRYADAKTAADQLIPIVGDAVKEIPMAEFLLPMPIFVRLRFQQWDEILRTPEPDRKLLTTDALWHFARGVAYAATGDNQKATAERNAFSEVQKQVPADSPFGTTNLNTDILRVAQSVLEARIEAASGHRKEAIARWREAVQAEDALAYDEPPPWYYPVRESLGAALFLDGQYAEAEKTFRDDLDRNPRNGRSLFGLRAALTAQNKTADAEWVNHEFGTAWKGAEVQLRLPDF